MFDDLRNDAAKQYEEESQAIYKPAANTAAAPRARSKKILGMTSVQRFVITFLLMLATCVLGSLCLFVTGRIGF
jgi:hypothetical protein